jgi:hypothetical protein
LEKIPGINIKKISFPMEKGSEITHEIEWISSMLKFASRASSPKDYTY